MYVHVYPEKNKYAPMNMSSLFYLPLLRWLFGSELPSTYILVRKKSFVLYPIISFPF